MKARTLTYLHDARIRERERERESANYRSFIDPEDE